MANLVEKENLTTTHRKEKDCTFTVKKVSEHHVLAFNEGVCIFTLDFDTTNSYETVDAKYPESDE